MLSLQSAISAIFATVNKLPVHENNNNHNRAPVQWDSNRNWNASRRRCTLWDNGHFEMEWRLRTHTRNTRIMVSTFISNKWLGRSVVPYIHFANCWTLNQRTVQLCNNNNNNNQIYWLGVFALELCISHSGSVQRMHSESKETKITADQRRSGGSRGKWL